MFLKKLYHQWRIVFYFLVLMMLAQGFFMFKAVETIPFFLFNMYSTRQANADTTYRTTVYANGTQMNLRNLSGREQESLLGSLSYFRKLKKNNYLATDTATIKKRLWGKIPGGWYPVAVERLTNPSVSDSNYLEWWASYLSTITGTKIDSFTILQSSVSWKPSYQLLNDTVSMIHYVNRK